MRRTERRTTIARRTVVDIAAAAEPEVLDTMAVDTMQLPAAEEAVAATVFTRTAAAMLLLLLLLATT